MCFTYISLFVKTDIIIFMLNIVYNVLVFRPMEAQVNSRELNLRLNEAGHVTGDMQMMLPPMRNISLDPYTGYVKMILMFAYCFVYVMQEWIKNRSAYFLCLAVFLIF